MQHKHVRQDTENQYESGQEIVSIQQSVWPFKNINSNNDCAEQIMSVKSTNSDTPTISQTISIQQSLSQPTEPPASDSELNFVSMKVTYGSQSGSSNELDKAESGVCSSTLLVPITKATKNTAPQHSLAIEYPRSHSRSNETKSTFPKGLFSPEHRILTTLKEGLSASSVTSNSTHLMSGSGDLKVRARSNSRSSQFSISPASFLDEAKEKTKEEKTGDGVRKSKLRMDWANVVPMRSIERSELV
ncbi:hypothetical protein HK096_007424, partial [Nowakowskiella sp. JEL0078]